ncbi:MAG TPA: choice-of-anchor X domain-containing protein [Planctomycetota bacterium]|nr:choice-of-anchor X domain-containing protein [Planctomycetota bacterium]
MDSRQREHRVRPFLTLFVALALRSLAVAGEEGVPPFESVETHGYPQREWRHTGKYPPFRITWVREARLTGVAAVFPHPTLPQRVAAATAAGFALSDDAGRTWAPLPEAAPAKVGAVRHVAFDPASPDVFYLATDARGVWATTDGGKTFRQIGSKASGMAADTVLTVHLYPPDMRFLTLLAIHGGAASGISVTEDGGRTWRVASPGYHAWKLLCCGADSLRLYMSASTREKPEVRDILSAASLGEPWYVVVRDVVPTDGATTVLRGDVYWATADAGVHLVTNNGANFEKVGPEGLARLPSIGVTWGHHADNQLFYAYEPTRLGMIVSADGFKTFTTHSQGLYASPFVTEGAHLRSNASGTVFYAAANGVLSKGYRFDGSLKISQVALAPPAFAFAPVTWSEGTRSLQRCLDILPKAAHAADIGRQIARFTTVVEEALSPKQVTITAMVMDQRGKPKSVTADLSRLGGSPRTPLLDDGQHGDGAAGDNVYGAPIVLRSREIHRDGRDWRREWPGPLGLTVTAVGTDGALSGAVGVLFAAKRPEGFLYWEEDSAPSVRNPTGEVSIAVDPHVAPPPTSKSSWRIKAGKGPWTLPIGNPYVPRDITGFHAVSLWVKSDGKSPDDLRVQFRDQPDYIAPTTTPPVSLGGAGAVTAKFRRVVIPLEPLLARTPGFLTRLFCWVVFSGEGRAQGTWWVDDIRLFRTKEDLETDMRLDPR